MKILPGQLARTRISLPSDPRNSGNSRRGGVEDFHSLENLAMLSLLPVEFDAKDWERQAQTEKLEMTVEAVAGVCQDSVGRFGPAAR